MYMKSILIVEDDEILWGFYARRLQDYDIRMVTNGSDALKEVEERCPDVVVLDINLPAIDGVEMNGLDFLKKCPNKFHTIIITNNPFMDETEAKKLGVDKYFRKANTSLKDATEAIKSLVEALPKQPDSLLP